MSNNLENDRSVTTGKMYPIDLAAPQKITIVKSMSNTEVKMAHLISGQPKTTGASQIITHTGPVGLMRTAAQVVSPGVASQPQMIVSGASILQGTQIVSQGSQLMGQNSQIISQSQLIGPSGQILSPATQIISQGTQLSAQVSNTNSTGASNSQVNVASSVSAAQVLNLGGQLSVVSSAVRTLPPSVRVLPTLPHHNSRPVLSSVNVSSAGGVLVSKGVTSHVPRGLAAGASLAVRPVTPSSAQPALAQANNSAWSGSGRGRSALVYGGRAQLRAAAPRPAAAPAPPPHSAIVTLPTTTVLTSSGVISSSSPALPTPRPLPLLQRNYQPTKSHAQVVGVASVGVRGAVGNSAPPQLYYEVPRAPRPLTPYHQSTHQPTHQTTHQSTHQPTHQPNHQQTHQSPHQPSHQPTHQVTHQSTLQAIHQPVHQAVHQQTHQSVHQQTHQSVHQQTHQPVHQQTHQPVHQQTHQPVHQPVLATSHVASHQQVHQPVLQPSHQPHQPHQISHQPALQQSVNIVSSVQTLCDNRQQITQVSNAAILPRPSILRKREVDGSPSKNTVSAIAAGLVSVGTNLTSTLNVNNVGVGVGNAVNLGGISINNIGISAVNLGSGVALSGGVTLNTVQGCVASCGWEDAGVHGSGSTTESAASSPDEEPDPPPHHDREPRKKPRKQMLTNEVRHCEFPSEDPPSTPPPIAAAVNPLPKRPLLSASYVCGWRGTALHFARPADVRRREPRARDMVAIASERHVLTSAEGWKVHHLTAQMDDLVLLEADVGDQLAAVLRALENASGRALASMQPHSHALLELIKGNIQRSKIVCEGIQEAREDIMRVFKHRNFVADILTRQADKRCFRKHRSQS